MIVVYNPYYIKIEMRNDFMKRLIDEKLLTWKEKDNRKPLYIYGARKVGKTYSVLQFAKAHYANVAYFHF